MAALAVQRLGHITGETRDLDAAERTLQLFYPALSRHPGGYAGMLHVLEEAMAPPQLVVIRGPDAGVRQWQQVLVQRYLPSTLILALSGSDAGLSPLLAKPFAPGAVNAWVCRGVTCLPPAGTLDALLDMLLPTEVR